MRSKTQVLGYLNASMESFTKDGWFRTGDLVEELEGGYIRIVGRNKEVINVGGEKVLPAEVESVLLEIGELKKENNKPQLYESYQRLGKINLGIAKTCLHLNELEDAEKTEYLRQYLGDTAFQFLQGQCGSECDIILQFVKQAIVNLIPKENKTQFKINLQFKNTSLKSEDPRKSRTSEITTLNDIGFLRPFVL